MRMTPSAAPSATRGKEGSSATHVRAAAHKMDDWYTTVPCSRSHTCVEGTFREHLGNRRRDVKRGAGCMMRGGEIGIVIFHHYYRPTLGGA
eukprot:3235247-Pyramimonas_sp.AAC.1